MGTTYTVRMMPGTVEPAVAQQLVEAELLRLNQIFSTYIPDSEISWLNRQPVGAALPLSAEMRELLALSMEVSQVTGGAFDITVGPLVALWGFGPEPPQLEAQGPAAQEGAARQAEGQGQALPAAARGVPSAADIEAAVQLVGWQALEVSQTLVKRQPAQLDLSAVAKGYAVDKLAELLRGAGVKAFLVEIGGEVYAEGRKAGGRPWLLAIEQPVAGQRRVQRALPLTDLGMATSGDYRNFFAVDGRRYGHTLDPRTGWPVSHNLLSVTVLDSSLARADAYATAFMVLGLEETMRIATAQGLAVLAIIREDGLEEVASPAMGRYLETD